jgi:nicotinamide mononucleotide transporter
MEVLMLILLNIANILSVWFAAKNNRATWSIGFFAACVTAYIFFVNKHYMSFAFNTYSAIMCIYGYFTWNKSNSDNDKNIKWNKRPIYEIIISIILFACIYSFNSTLSLNPILDTICTSLSIVAAYLLVKQDVNAWIIYITTDILYIYLGVISQDWEYIPIYGIMLILAIYGACQYIKKFKKQLQ